MEMLLMNGTTHTQIKVRIKEYPHYEGMIQAYILLHGGGEIRRSSTFIYFEIDADLLNKDRPGRKSETIDRT